ncbi:unnamed protein product [Meganyctiphanes norvegica]|uniref:G-protein coupled receptors family 1 profile domain-containing protein n=1 Tax=Meganyctiphanes norvegica TaxID=48144 RepID=A0AAV2QQY2_MEGNR
METVQSNSKHLNLTQLATQFGMNASSLYSELAKFAKESIENNVHNFSSNVSLETSQEEDTRHSVLAIVEVIVLAVIFLVAVIGNSAVLVALWRHSLFTPITRSHLFMLHLSMADFLVAIFNILPQLVWDITYRFSGSDLLCRLVKYFQVAVLYLSTYVLVFMAVDRAWAIQGSGHGSLRTARRMAMAAWIIGLVLALPQLFLFSMQEVKPGVTDCWVFFSQLGEQIYVTWFVISVFLFPLGVIILCYGYIARVLWKSMTERHREKLTCIWLCCKKIKKMTGHQSGPVDIELESLPNGQRLLPADQTLPPNVTKLTAAKLKTIRMTLTVVACFILCWSPFCVAQLLAVYRKLPNTAMMHPLQVICMFLASLNSCTNPWIYLSFSATLTRQLRIILGMVPGSSKNNSVDDDVPAQQQPAPRRGGPIPNKGPPSFYSNMIPTPFNTLDDQTLTTNQQLNDDIVPHETANEQPIVHDNS